MITWYTKIIDPKDRHIYPCDMCGYLMSENEGGRIFTVCEDCWDKTHRCEWLGHAWVENGAGDTVCAICHDVA